MHKPGTIVETQSEGWNGTYYPRAVVVAQPEDTPAPNDTESWVWIKYDNGCVVPVREHRVWVADE